MKHQIKNGQPQSGNSRPTKSQRESRSAQSACTRPNLPRDLDGSSSPNPITWSKKFFQVGTRQTFRTITAVKPVSQQYRNANRTLARPNGSEQTRQQILAAALRLFATHGYAGTSTQAIIAASRVSKPVLYYHFGSKAGLFRVIVDDAENQLLEVILKSKASAPDVRSQLEEICAALFQLARENPLVIGLAMELTAAARRCPVWKNCLGKLRRRHAVMGKIMDRGINEGLFGQEFSNEQLAVGFLGLVQGHILHFLCSPAWPLNRSRAEAVVFSFLNGTGDKPRNFPMSLSEKGAQLVGDDTAALPESSDRL